MSDVRHNAFSDRSADSSSSADALGVSRFPCKEFPRVPRVCDCAGPVDSSPLRHLRSCLPLRSTASASRMLFHSSIPGLRVPLSTLRRAPCGCRRMTRGRRGWLGLHRATLSFTTPCRSSRRTERYLNPIFYRRHVSGTHWRGVKTLHRRCADEWRRIISAQPGSGLSIAAYCRSRGISQLSGIT